MNAENMLEQLRLAMKNQPSLSMTEVINEALDLKFSSRKYDEFHLIVEKNTREKWRPTNDDIYSALVTYNKVRYRV